MPVATLQNLSPKDMACTIGVSESSLKRWVDEGRLRATRTNGGHRRIPLREAVRFLRRAATDLAQPEMLGLPDLTGDIVHRASRGLGETILYEAIRRGDGSLARGVVVAEFLLSRMFGQVCDGVMSYALNRLSEEHRAAGDGRPALDRATDILCAAVHQVHGLLEEPGEGAPRAIGCQFSAGIPDLAGAMAACVLRECGYADSSIAEDSWRFSSVPGSLNAERDLLWIGVSSPLERPRLEAFLSEFGARLAAGPRLLVCGRGAAGLELSGRFPGVLVAGSYSELQSIARALKAEHAIAQRQADSKHRARPGRLA